MLNLKVDNSEAVLMLEGLLAGIDDFSPAWPKVEQIVMDMERQQFETQGEFGGEEWEPLNETYAEYKRKTYGSTGILVATGMLKGSLTTKGGAGHYYNAGPNFVEIGTLVPYAGYHQRGHETPTRLPKRTVIPIPPKPVGEDIADVLQAHIYQKMRSRLRGPVK